MITQHCIPVSLIHSENEAAKVIAKYLKDGAGDSMRVVRFIDAIDDDGESSLITACRIWIVFFFDIC